MSPTRLSSKMLIPKDTVHNLPRALDGVANALHDATHALFRRGGSICSSVGSNSETCNTPTAGKNTQLLAIILGVVIPLGSALAVLIYLHRRHIKKQRLEDQHDPHKSLDFGMGSIHSDRRETGDIEKGPEMSVREPRDGKHTHAQGLSLDLSMHMNSPYIMPGAINASHESFHSMSRNIGGEHDPYRPVIKLTSPTSDHDSQHFGRGTDDKGSLHSVSTGHHSAHQDKAGLVPNAHAIPQPIASRHADVTSLSDTTSPVDATRTLHSAASSPRAMALLRTTTLDRSTPDLAEEQVATVSGITPIVKEPKILNSGKPPTIKEPEAPHVLPTPMVQESKEQNAPHPRSSSARAPRSLLQSSISTVETTSYRPESSNYGDADSIPPTVNVVSDEKHPDKGGPAITVTAHANEPASAQRTQRLRMPQPVMGQRLSVMGLRPLPPDVPDDNPEVRANRIRSFYKEYFDENKPNPACANYGVNAIGVAIDGVVYDPVSGGFFAPDKPFAQGPGRRAMTPPPRARPRVGGNPPNGSLGRKLSVMSAGQPRGQSLPKKVLPPPKPLTDLPTPYMMRDDSAIFNATDFAPLTTFRNLQNGSQPASPSGMQRPFSPNLRPFTPLASSFDHLTPLPSPHDLRKSGTFTALDFAPPSKIRDPWASPSDAGSIRSNRSGMSTVHMHALREGAYRVSRIPKELVSSQDDLAAQLRPKMNLTAPA